MKKTKPFLKGILSFYLILVMGVLASCGYVDSELFMEETPNEETPNAQSTIQQEIKEEEAYSSKEEVAAYLCRYDELPSNYLTKSEAGELGWDHSQGNLWDVTDEMSIGGDRFGNREGLLPTKKGRVYYEADVNYQGGYRNAERIVFSNDGLIFYTDDHYDSFEQLYTKEDAACNE